MFLSILRWHRSLDIVIVDIYSGRAFLVADLITWQVRHLGRPLVVMLHGGGLPDLRRRHPWWVARVLRRADHIVAPSPFLARAFSDLSIPISVIPNTIRLEAYTFTLRDKPRPNILWMRSFSDVYRPWLAVRALAQLLHRFPDAVLTMAGQPGPLLEPTQSLVSDLGLEKHVHFVGFLDKQGKQRAFAENDVFLSTNSVDNTPVSAIEAAAAGLPIVACDVGGIADLFRDGESAVLVQEPDHLGGGIERVLTEPGLAAQLSRNARMVAEASDWSQVVRRWDALYDSVLAPGAP